MRGSEMNDAFEKRGKNIVTKTNRAGGLSGGISNGMPIVLRVAIKPTASIGLEQDTVDLKTGKAAKVSIKGRHDPCIVPRAVPIVEAMAAIVLADHGIRSGIITRRLLK
jgi:chorismate synthase